MSRFYWPFTLGLYMTVTCAGIGMQLTAPMPYGWVLVAIAACGIPVSVGGIMGFEWTGGGWEWTNDTGRHWLRVEPVFEWLDWVPRLRRNFHWVDFTPIHVRYMNDLALAGKELDLVLLGVGVHVRYTDHLMLQASPVWNEIKEQVDEFTREEGEAA